MQDMLNDMSTISSESLAAKYSKTSREVSLERYRLRLERPSRKISVGKEPA